jgi:hypothetical protein
MCCVKAGLFDILMFLDFRLRFFIWKGFWGNRPTRVTAQKSVTFAFRSTTTSM